jgi:hypothetical protein
MDPSFLKPIHPLLSLSNKWKLLQTSLKPEVAQAEESLHENAINVRGIGFKIQIAGNLNPVKRATPFKSTAA